MRRILRWAVGLPIAIIVISFAVANRRWVTLSLDPFSQEAPKLAMDLPLWLLFFLGIFVGIIIGWVGSWFAQAKHRKAAREARAAAAALQAELTEIRRPDAASHRQQVTPFEGGFL